MRTKRTNPYSNLLERIKTFIWELKNPRSAVMFFWPVEKLSPEIGWRLDAVYQRTLAAQSLGCEVIIVADDKGMTVKYKKKPKIPYSWE